MLPSFIYNFGSTLDALGEPVEPGAEQRTFVDLVVPFCTRFGLIGLVSGVTGFTMVTLWSIIGERQVTVSWSSSLSSQGLSCGCWWGGSDRAVDATL